MSLSIIQEVVDLEKDIQAIQKCQGELIKALLLEEKKNMKLLNQKE